MVLGFGSCVMFLRVSTCKCVYECDYVRHIMCENDYVRHIMYENDYVRDIIMREFINTVIGVYE